MNMLEMNYLGRRYTRLPSDEKFYLIATVSKDS